MGKSREVQIVIHPSGIGFIKEVNKDINNKMLGKTAVFLREFMEEASEKYKLRGNIKVDETLLKFVNETEAGFLEFLKTKVITTNERFLQILLTKDIEYFKSFSGRLLLILATQSNEKWDYYSKLWAENTHAELATKCLPEYKKACKIVERTGKVSVLQKLLRGKHPAGTVERKAFGFSGRLLQGLKNAGKTLKKFARKVILRR